MLDGTGDSCTTVLFTKKTSSPILPPRIDAVVGLLHQNPLNVSGS